MQKPLEEIFEPRNISDISQLQEHVSPCFISDEQVVPATTWKWPHGQHSEEVSRVMNYVMVCESVEFTKRKN